MNDSLLILIRSKSTCDQCFLCKDRKGSSVYELYSNEQYSE